MRPTPSPAALAGEARILLGRPGRGRLAGRRDLDPGPIEAVIAARVQTKVSHLGSRDGPVQAHVEGNPRDLLSEEDLGPSVDALALRPEEDLARTDQDIVEPLIAVEGEVGRSG